MTSQAKSSAAGITVSRELQQLRRAQSTDYGQSYDARVSNTTARSAPVVVLHLLNSRYVGASIIVTIQYRQETPITTYRKLAYHANSLLPLALLLTTVA